MLKCVSSISPSPTAHPVARPSLTSASNLPAEMPTSSMIGNAPGLQAERAKVAGILGLSLPPAIADAWAEKIAFDGIGRVVGLKSELSMDEIRRLIQQQTTPLNRQNAVGERHAPKTESASLIAFVSELRKDGSPVAKLLADRAQAMWLNGQVNTQGSIALYKQAVDQLHDRPALSAMAESLLTDARMEKTSGQYIDNLFGRYFDSEFAHALIQRPTASALKISAQIGHFLVEEFDSEFKKFFPDPAGRESRLIGKMQAFAKAIAEDTRPWFSEVPELKTFLAQPTYEHFKLMMGKVDNGFDMIKVPFLAVKMATTPGMYLDTASWKAEGDSFYWKEIIKARSTGSELSAGVDTSYKVSLQEKRTRNYGTLLPHHGAIGQHDYPDFGEGRDVAAGKVLTPGKETPFERNALSQGLTVVTGASGSTNIMTHLNRHIGLNLADFSQSQAYLNTLAFLVFDGGHSVNESLAVYRALSAPDGQRAQVLQDYTANYRDIQAMLPESEQDYVRRALGDAFDKTVELHRDLAQVPPEVNAFRQQSTRLNSIKFSDKKTDTPPALYVQDHLDGGLPMGDAKISRTSLYNMGATLDGKPIDLASVQKYNNDQDWIEVVQFDAKKFGQHIKSSDGNRLTELLMEIGSRPRVGPLFVAPQADLTENNQANINKSLNSLNYQLERLRTLVASAGNSAIKSNPATLIVPGKGAMTFNNVGVGLQVFGIYNNIRGITNSIARGDAADAAIYSSGLAAQGFGAAAEIGLANLGKSFQKGGATSLTAFSQTRLGKALGGTAKLGPNLGRAGGVVGGVITLPFDIYSMYTSFNQAAKSKGKAAQDHYVSGGLATAGVGISAVLTGAGAAGFTAAGPIGIVAGGLLAAAGGIYHSARYVEDLGEYTDLSGGEKFVTGLSAFFGGGASQDIERRVAIGKERAHYSAAKSELLRRFLKYNPAYGYAVFGDAVIKSQDPIIRKGFPNNYGVRRTIVTPRPPMVIDNAADDTIDAKSGIAGVSNVVKSAEIQGGHVLWATGHGNDALNGVNDRSNTFVLGKGRKDIVGGQKNDVFQLDSVPMNNSTFDGGDGVDTLQMSFNSLDKDSVIRISLPTVERQEEVADPSMESDENSAQNGSANSNVHETQSGFVRFARGNESALRSIENVITSKNARTFVEGNRGNNVFVLNGRGDNASGGSGDDTYVINGSGTINICAGDGYNRYQVSSGIDVVNINSIYHNKGRHELVLDFNSGDFVVRAVKNSDKLEIVFNAERPNKRIVISNVFYKNKAGEVAPLREDGSIVLVTRDGYIITPTLSSIGEYPDGYLHMGVMLKMANTSHL